MRLSLDSIAVSAIAFVETLHESPSLAADFVQDQAEAPNINLAIVWLGEKYLGGLAVC